MAKHTKRRKSKAASPTRAEIRDTPRDAGPAPARWKVPLQALVIIAAGLWIYWPALSGGWLWDDDLYVTDNRLLHDLNGLWRIWFVPGAAREYYPLDMTVWWIEWHLWGMKTTGYHVVNLACHLAGSLLVWRLLAKFKLRLAWLGGLLFAIHPLQVESAAWIAEMKNTLSLPFFLLAMMSWMDFEEHRRRRDYLLALALFTVAMLGKPTMLVFPAVILIYAWWKRGRVTRRDLAASAPFFLVSLVLGLVTVGITQHMQPMKGTVPIAAPDNLLSRAIASGLLLPFVFWYTLLPLGLMPIYPPPQVDLAAPEQYLPWPLLAAVVAYLWTQRRTWGRHALLGLGFFLAMLAPVLGFVAANYRTMTWSMDHLDYLPMIGMTGLAVAGLGQLAEVMPRSLRMPGIAVLALVLAGLAWESRAYTWNYVDDETMLRCALKSNPLAWLANYNLGRHMLNTGRTDEAIAQFEQVLKFVPGYPNAHDMLGKALLQAGRVTEAEDQFEQALQTKPDYAEAHYNLGNALKESGRAAEAIGQYQEALTLNPEMEEAHYNWGNLLLRADRNEEAMEQYRAAIALAPDYADAHFNLANALLKSNRLPEAIAEFELAAKFNPGEAGIHYGWGNALYVSGRTDDAIAQFEQALKIDPAMAEAHYNLGYALMQTAHAAEAIEQFEETLKINPGDSGARQNLEKLQALEQAAPKDR